jgi:hypothetical protein
VLGFDPRGGRDVGEPAKLPHAVRAISESILSFQRSSVARMDPVYPVILSKHFPLSSLGALPAPSLSKEHSLELISFEEDSIASKQKGE